MQWIRRLPALTALAFLAPAAAQEGSPSPVPVASPECAANAPEMVERFPAMTIKAFERLRPMELAEPGFQIDASRPGFIAVVSQTCEVRAIPEAKLAFLQVLGKTFGAPEIFALYERELHVREDERDYWIPFQKDTIEHILTHACSEPQISIRVRYFGVHSELGQVLLGIGYTADAVPPEPYHCFADRLAGIEVGAPFESTRQALAERLGGELPAPPPRNEERQHVYAVSRERGTVLIISDAGSGHRTRVFSVQVSGPPNPDLELHGGLRLGDPPARVLEVLGPPTDKHDSGDGYEQWRWGDSPCSIEMRGGVLASLLITDDPNYFAD